MISILFVCHGNICRSPMAEFVMKELVRKSGLKDVYIESAATSTEELGNDMHRGTKRKLREEGIPFERRGARQVKRSDIDRFDLIIGMDSYNLRNLNRMLGGAAHDKIHLLLDFSDRRGEDIADPWYTGDFDTTFNDILEGCEGLLEYLLAKK